MAGKFLTAIYIKDFAIYMMDAITGYGIFDIRILLKHALDNVAYGLLLLMLWLLLYFSVG